MKTVILALIAAFAAAPLTAQTLPEPGTVFVYDVIEFAVPSEQTSETANVTFLEARDNEIAVVFCFTTDFCEVEVRRDLIKSLAELYGEESELKTLDIATIMNDPERISVAISDEVGGPTFPLVDGKEQSWTEDWSGNNWSAQYKMTATQSCCVRGDIPAAKAAELWELHYTYELVPDEPDRVQRVELVSLYDPELGWFVSHKFSNQTRNEGEEDKFRFRRDALIEVLPAQ